MPVAVDDGAEQRREALPIERVHLEFLLDEDHDDAAIAVGLIKVLQIITMGKALQTYHRQMHGRVAEFISDVLLGARVEEVADE